MSRIALITGATSGIGKATAEVFAKSGIDLILCGRRQEKLDEVSGTVSSQVRVTTLVFDVRDKGAVLAMIGSLPDEWKNIDILINNAGNAHGLGSLDEGDMEDWDAMIDGNVKGLLYVSKAVIPLMLERAKGHIVNISSIAGKQTYANGTVYCASKAAVEAVSEGMRLELTQHGIKVTNVAPGAVETEFSLVRFKGDESRAEKVYQGFDPLQAADIADAILYAVNAPARVTIADLTILASAQSAATVIYKKQV
ncbi:SDR family NAD(P)-dependent oxidoreductase [Dyadobacter sediminis]|uniref:SDR family NAD(P)-dependent oxidoreductase n=1 Tax=Dyadobacter sediminis TaxID=1493691 RepID=A0A5R9K5Y5_9BACT|nr:SDR family NAD(P)-dependent oxidoreductase [Dyadobacter sediminis]TLU89072.1 SDR family NAD(P)-dependent oxidoreductase [Dyadobacter sediminis]GGC03019.1 L-allo-threonine dehydrogenase [Dyadobacter sediminis]